MAEIHVRTFLPADLPALVAVDHSVSTEIAWQMDIQEQNRNTTVIFREVKLPRPVRLQYPRDPNRIIDDWRTRLGTLVATLSPEGDAIGYISFADDGKGYALRVVDLAVDKMARQQGVATALLLAAHDWAHEYEYSRLVLEMQARNAPAINLVRRLGFEFNGFSDHYFPNEDIALFFAKKI